MESSNPVVVENTIHGVKKTLKNLLGLLLILVVTAGLISIIHPIFLKWLSGSARLIGRPIKALVYTNGKIDRDIRIFHVDHYWNGQKADYFLLQIPYTEKSKLKVISLNRKENYAGRPSSTNKHDYDSIFGFLFQSEVGSQFTPFIDNMKGFAYDPQISFSDKKIKFNIPPTIRDLLKCDSIRIEL